jgi:D-alanyl-D-alanine carboxypeptidase
MVQAVLKWKGHYRGPVTAKFDAATARAVAEFQGRGDQLKTGRVDRATGQMLGLPFWDPAIELQTEAPYRDTAKYPDGFVFRFRSLADGGFFSAVPHKGYTAGNPLTLRAIRTNNPGVLNFSRWQKDMTGYVGKTEASASADHSQTAIFMSPEHGVSAWAYLLRVKYFNGNREPVLLTQIVEKYRGGRAVSDYIRGYNKFSNGTLTSDTLINLYDNRQLAVLAIAAFSHELGTWYPLTDGQISMGLQLADQHTEVWRQRTVLQRMRRIPRNVLQYFDKGACCLGHNEARFSDD